MLCAAVCVGSVWIAVCIVVSCERHTNTENCVLLAVEATIFVYVECTAVNNQTIHIFGDGFCIECTATFTINFFSAADTYLHRE